LAERKNFLIMAIGIGGFGVIVGGITIWNLVSEIINP
jgi:hypothetical protein